MNLTKILIALGCLAAAVAMAVFSSGVLLPFALPLFAYGLKETLGVEL